MCSSCPRLKQVRERIKITFISPKLTLSNSSSVIFVSIT
jgi:hypothetical protein